ncbi:MAG: hypothetical protein Q8M97_10425 [Methanobacteriaceae archaeon]|jgi:hypothetical protein|nr:hypothetical protein [Methanobacteriaceae archaeon]
MGFSEKIEQMANEKERERGIKDINRLFSYLGDCDIEGLDEVLAEIKVMCESKFYIELVDAFRSENNISKDRVFTVEELLKVRILRLADNNLRHGNLIDTIMSRSVITAKYFISIYSFIEFTYCIFNKKPTKFDDAINIFFSRLDERIIFALDHFDKFSLDEIPEPTPEYFQAIRKLEWKDKKTKKLYNKLTELMREVMDFSLDYSDLIERVQKISTYRSTEDLFILTLAGCSVVNDSRQKIEYQDIIIAYNTFFKLIKTDVTKYKAIPELVQGINGYQGNASQDGYLVCDKCNSHYKLESGESADDFEDTCDCGGHLVYKETI